MIDSNSSASPNLIDSWPLLALVPGRKVPVHDEVLQPHGCHSATTDPDRIRELWSRNPDANVGLATGHVFDVVDLDGAHAVNLLRERGLVPPPTRVVRTPRGGWHIYIQHDSAIPTAAGLLTDGCVPPCQIDTRGTGGYVVAPPSVVNGRRYVLVRDLPVAPWPEFVEFCRSRANRKVVTPQTTGPSAGGGLIAQIKAAWSVEELAERLGARLIRRGDQLKARCPLHGERRGLAFVIWRSDQRWRCFGKCSTGGDVIDLYRAARGRGLL